MFWATLTWATFVFVFTCHCRWEVPLPHVLREIYMHREGTDPRFIKLEPVFKCAMLRRRNLQRYLLGLYWIKPQNPNQEPSCTQSNDIYLNFLFIDLRIKVTQTKGIKSIPPKEALFFSHWKNPINIIIKNTASQNKRRVIYVLYNN